MRVKMTNLLVHYPIHQRLPSTCNKLQNRKRKNKSLLDLYIASCWQEGIYRFINTTHSVCLVQRSAFDIVPMAVGLVQVWARMAWTVPRVWAGDRRGLSEAIHISGLLLIGNQILNFLTKELFNSLREENMKQQDHYSIFRDFKTSNIINTT